MAPKCRHCGLRLTQAPDGVRWMLLAPRYLFIDRFACPDAENGEHEPVDALVALLADALLGAVFFDFEDERINAAERLAEAIRENRERFIAALVVEPRDV